MLECGSVPSFSFGIGCCDRDRTATKSVTTKMDKSFRNLTAARVKLREIEKLRTRNELSFSKARQECDAATTSLSKLRILTEALKETESEVPDMKMLFDENVAGNTSDTTIHALVEELKTQMTHAEHCSEISYVQAKLLEEWLLMCDKDDLLLQMTTQEARQNYITNLNGLRKEASNSCNFDVIDSVFQKDGGKALDALQKSVQEIEKDLVKKVAENEISAAAGGALQKGIAGPSDAAELQAIVEDRKLRQEYAGLVSLMIRNMEEWDWPVHIPTRLVHTSHDAKLRWLLSSDTVTTLFVEVLGLRLQRLMKPRLRRFYATLAGWDNQLLNCVAKQWGSLSFRGVAETSAAQHELRRSGELFLSSLQHNLTTKQPSYGHSDSEPAPGADRLLLFSAMALHAKSLHDKSSDDRRELVLVSSDVEALGMTLPHEVVSFLAAKIGFSAPWLAIFEKFMRCGVLLPDVNGGISEDCEKNRLVMRRGLVMSHAMSQFMSELVIFVVDCLVATTGRFLCRFHDDVFLWDTSVEGAAKAWTAFAESLNACGLRINQQSTGCTVALSSAERSNAELQTAAAASGLPMTRPAMWRGLALDREANWTIRSDVLQALISRYSNVLLKSDFALYSSVRLWNSFAKDLLFVLGPVSPALGLEHAQSVVKEIRRACQAVSGGGVVQALRSAIVDRFGAPTHVLVDAWFYWPVSCGGLALTNPLTEIAPMLFALKGQEPISFDVADGVAAQSEKFFLAKAEQPTRPVAPASTNLHKSWLAEFRTRRSQLWKDHTETRGYWQWVVATYGHEVRRVFGTFGLINPELTSTFLIEKVRAIGE
eukprot:Polyplicarium_translucidae@DN3373_c0_g1_i10.p1